MLGVVYLLWKEITPKEGIRSWWCCQVWASQPTADSSAALRMTNKNATATATAKATAGPPAARKDDNQKAKSKSQGNGNGKNKRNRKGCGYPSLTMQGRHLEPDLF
jgi:hypothetical protein